MGSVALFEESLTKVGESWSNMKNFHASFSFHVCVSVVMGTHTVQQCVSCVDTSLLVQVSVRDQT